MYEFIKCNLFINMSIDFQMKLQIYNL